jgi:hypothetical protein
VLVYPRSRWLTVQISSKAWFRSPAQASALWSDVNMEVAGDVIRAPARNADVKHLNPLTPSTGLSSWKFLQSTIHSFRLGPNGEPVPCSQRYEDYRLQNDRSDDPLGYALMTASQ